MYTVSDEYREAMHGTVHRFKLHGTVGTAEFDEDNILAGSFSITNQCSGTDTVDIGQVYIGELDATFINMDIARKSWKGRAITPYFSRQLADGTYEDVPLGIFTVTTADWTSSGVVVKAYDNMSLFDVSCGETLTSATAYELLQIICERCGMLLGNTEEEIAALPNGGRTLAMRDDSDADTWRDVLSWLSQTLGCFATAGRDGKLYLRKYGTDAVDTLDMQHRFKGGSFSDFSTYYTGLSVVNMGDGTTSYYGLETDDGLTMNLGSNPFLQYGVDEELETMRRDVLDAVALIDYVPFRVSMVGDPAYDLGDVLLFTDGLAGEEAVTCITKFVFTYGRSYEAQGVGKDPALASAKSKTDKNISGLINSMEDEGMHFSVFRNSTALSVEDGESCSVMYVRFVTVKTAHVEICLEMHLEVETTEEETDDGWTYHDAVCEVSYYFNGELISDFSPVETWQDGKHVLSLRYDLQSVQAQTNSFDVWLKMTGGSATIGKMDILEVVGGMGMAASGEWDGTIDATEVIDGFDFLQMYGTFTDSVLTEFVEMEVLEMNENIKGLDFTSMFPAFGESVGADNGLMVFSTVTNADLVTTECEISDLAWQGSGTVALGTALSVILPALNGITHVETVSENAIYYVSFDGGETWEGYTEDGWAQDSAMLRDAIEAVPESAWKDNVIIKVILETDATLGELNIYGGYIND